MKKQTYLGRGIHNEEFLNSLSTGKLKAMLEAINTEANSNLDVQIRNNFLNVYYNGANIAKVSGENNVDFDQFYFSLDKDRARNVILEDQAYIDDLKSKKAQLIKKFNNGDFEAYFAEAKAVIDAWLVEFKKPELVMQHQLAIENRFEQSDYTIIDLDYQVSAQSEFACKLLGVNGKAKKPKFDIIAVSKEGKLCVIEYRKGTGSLAGVTGLKEQFDCYNQSIALNHKAFMAEMKELLKQKQLLGLINEKLEITSPHTEFMFAYSYETNDKEREDRIFVREYKKFKAKPRVIKLKKGSLKLEE